MSLKGLVHDLECTFELDSGAAISLASPDFLKPSDVTVSYSMIKGIDNNSVNVPCYMLPIRIHGVNGDCVFAIYEGLPAKYVLLGRDLGGSLFNQLMSSAQSIPMPI